MAAHANSLVRELKDGFPLELQSRYGEVGGLAVKHVSRENRVRSFGYWKPSKPKSKEAIGRDKDKLHVLLIREFLRCRRALSAPNMTPPEVLV